MTEARIIGIVGAALILAGTLAYCQRADAEPVTDDFIVAGVLDGDTVKMVDRCDKYFPGSISIRIDGIDTAEKKFVRRRKGSPAPSGAKCEAEAKHGLEAQAFAKTLLSKGDTVTVTLKSRDSYWCRYDGDITLPDGRDFATVMLNTKGSNGKPFARLYKKNELGRFVKSDWCR